MVTIKKISFHQFTCVSLVVISMIVQQSCIDDEFTLPVRIYLSVKISEQNKTDNTLSFESGEIVINGIQFNGQREAGGDYTFNTRIR